MKKAVFLDGEHHRSVLKREHQRNTACALCGVAFADAGEDDVWLVDAWVWWPDGTRAARFAPAHGRCIPFGLQPFDVAVPITSRSARGRVRGNSLT